MKIILSEVKFLFAFVLLVCGFAILSTIHLFNTPVQISEMALILAAIAIALLVVSVRLFKSSMKQV